jgi:hypothetical protein
MERYRSAICRYGFRKFSLHDTLDRVYPEISGFFPRRYHCKLIAIIMAFRATGFLVSVHVISHEMWIVALMLTMLTIPGLSG